jgi:hypothetical protein
MDDGVPSHWLACVFSRGRHVGVTSGSDFDVQRNTRSAIDRRFYIVASGRRRKHET